MRRSRVVLVAGLLAVSLGLGGCSGDHPQPKIAPPESSAPTSGSPSAEPAAESPEEVVRSWVEARNSALNSGSTDAVESLSAATCKSCAGLIEPIKRIYAAGGKFETQGWRVVKAKEKQPGMERPVVNTAMRFAGGVTTTAAGQEPQRYPPEKHIVVFKLVRESGGWTVDFVGFLS